MQANSIRGALQRPRLINSTTFTTKFRPLSRPISLWTSNSTNESTPSSSFLPDTPESDFVESTTSISTLIHDPTFFEPISEVLLSVPPSLSMSYAIAIPLLTLLIRTTTTLPLTLWQRSRTRKFEDVVMPLIQKAQVISEIEVRAECRRANKSFEEYQAAHKIRAKADAAKISKANSAHPMLTLLLPPLLHLPIFIGTTLVVRDACQRSLNALPLLPTSPTNFYSEEALNNLHQLASTPILWCESMVLSDSTMAFPLAVGLVLLANVESSAKNRLAIAKAHAAISSSKLNERKDAENKLIEILENRPAGRLSSSDKIILRKKRELDSRAKTMRRDPIVTQVKVEGPIEVEAKPETRFSKTFTSVLRVTSIFFIPIAALSPSAVCAYWLTSNLFTLTQNTIFAALDRKRTERRARLYK